MAWTRRIGMSLCLTNECRDGQFNNVIVSSTTYKDLTINNAALITYCVDEWFVSEDFNLASLISRDCFSHYALR